MKITETHTALLREWLRQTEAGPGPDSPSAVVLRREIRRRETAAIRYLGTRLNVTAPLDNIIDAVLDAFADLDKHIDADGQVEDHGGQVEGSERER